jgi:tRNA(fMet)-specific endonuclease VapC
MKFLLDTDTCVFWLRGRPSVRERLLAVGVENVGVSVTTLAELRYGAACSAQAEANQQAVDNLISGLALVGIGPEACRIFGDLKAALRTRGQLIEDFDLLIAATALAHGLTLVTSNTDHFNRIPGLALENWK